MVRIQLSSLDEFVASLSRLDYEAAKVASGKVMEDHIRMGALMFSLLTIEMMYTSMDYLTPENFRRGNNYLLNMYSPLPRQLNKLLRKLVSEYEEEHQKLIFLNVRPASKGSAAHSIYDGNIHGHQMDIEPRYGHGSDEANARRMFAAPTMLSNESGASRGNTKAHTERERQLLDPGATRRAPEYHTKSSRPGSSSAEPFDPNQYLANMEEADAVLRELETVRQFVEFITKFVEVRKTMVVLYRFVAVTGPVMYVHKLRTMLDRCQAVIQAIEPNPLYACLFDHVRHEVWLVSNLVDWNCHIVAYDFVQTVTYMKKAKQQLRAWQNILPAYSKTRTPGSRRSTVGHSIYESISDALGGRRDKDPGGQHANHGFLYTALAKSSQMMQNLLRGNGSSGANDSGHEPSSSGTRGIVVWITTWVDYLSFKTTTYFQQIITPYRSLYHDDMTAHAKQAAVMGDTWSRPGTAKTNLFEMVSEFMQANDGCFVALLFESSKQHPFAADGFAVSGTKVQVSDYRVQACAVLFCFTNQQLLRSRGISVRESLVHDVHTGRSDPATRGTAETQQSDVEWFRQNCLPDILYILDNDRTTLDFELLGSSPLLNQLGTDTDELLVELCDSVHDTVEEAAAQLAISKEVASSRQVAEMGTRDSDMSIIPPGTAQSQAGQASEALRLSAMKALSSAEQRLQQSAASKHDSKHHSPSTQSVLTSERSGLSEPQQRLQTLDSGPHSTLAVQPSSSGSGAAPAHIPVSEGHDSDVNLSLYSTYLRKSHLRNNVQHPLAHGGSGGQRYANRQTLQHTQGSDSQSIGSSYFGAADSTEDIRRRTVHEGLSTIDNIYGKRAGSMIGAGGQSIQDSASRSAYSKVPPVVQRHALQDSSATTNQHTEPTAAVDYLTSRGSASTLKSDMLDNATFQRRVSVDALATPSQARRQTAQDSTQVPRRTGRATTTTLGTASAKPRRPSLSIRSFFRQAPRPSTQSRAQPTATPGASESELARRVRCGQRLQELFGPWNQSELDETPDDVSAVRENSHRPSSIHSLSFSTPMRASLGRRAGVGGMGVGSTDTDVDPTYHEGVGSRLLRLPQSPTQANHAHARPQGSRPPATQRASEFGHAVGVEYLQHRSQPPRPQHPHEQPVKPLPPQAPHAGQPPTLATGGSEGYTYLYSRVGLPNVVLVAVILDSNKGIERRREAEHAWDSVVDAVRGASLFDRLMAFSG
ncbi:hypothetical protein IW148_001722 [Coemansia sp. RSA 1199]|nr:hypothetical protein IW148_001722 [Coemansia sp. RSA 1199]